MAGDYYSSDKRRLWLIEWRHKNREKLNARARERHAKNPEATRLRNAARKDYSRAWREAHADELRAYGRQYYRANIEQFQKDSRAYYLRTRDQAIARAAQWAAANPERRDEIQKAWNIANPEKRVAIRDAWLNKNPWYTMVSSRLRRKKIRSAMPTWVDLEEISAIYQEAANRRAMGETVDVDHIIPLTHKMVCGLHVPANLQVISAFENRSKGNKFVTDWS